MFNKKTLRDIDLANVLTHQPEYLNLNVLQFAAVTGDIRLLEKIVAYGAAIDSPVKESRKRIISGASWHKLQYSGSRGCRPRPARSQARVGVYTRASTRPLS